MSEGIMYKISIKNTVKQFGWQWTHLLVQRQWNIPILTIPVIILTFSNNMIHLTKIFFTQNNNTTGINRNILVKHTIIRMVTNLFLIMNHYSLQEDKNIWNMEAKKMLIKIKHILVGRSLLKESLLTDYQYTSSARTMECAGRTVLYSTCIFLT